MAVGFFKYLLAIFFIIILKRSNNIFENIKKHLQFIIEICYNIKDKEQKEKGSRKMKNGLKKENRIIKSKVFLIVVLFLLTF